MLKPYDPALMEADAVNRAVNSFKNDTDRINKFGKKKSENRKVGIQSRLTLSLP
jgi:hypothetical protein